MRNETQTDNELSYVVLVDPPDCPYTQSSAALLYSVKAWADLITDIDPVAGHVEDFTHLVRVMEPALHSIAEALISQMDSGDNQKAAVAQQITAASGGA